MRELEEIRQKVDQIEQSMDQLASAIFNGGFEIEFSGSALEAVQELFTRMDKITKDVAILNKQVNTLNEDVAEIKKLNQ